jgi:sugar phosphate isomerase/epimerase
MKFAMCNEFCENWPVEDALHLARDVGYDGVEIAPFTIAETVDKIPAARRDAIRAAAESAGVEIIGLHWLLVGPKDVHMTTADVATRQRTQKYFLDLIRLCADLGGDRMVIGSPKQRNIEPGSTPEQAWQRAVDLFRGLLPLAEEKGVVLCIEPLARTETDFIYTVGQGVRMVDEIDHPNFRVHIDVKAMCDEGRPLDEIIRGAAGKVGHFHVNDANRNGPGWGDTDFGPIVRGVRDIGYDDYASVEVFDFQYDPRHIAQSSLDFLQRVFA